uniref:tRNA(Ile)-lysidine synthase n=1 Tax=Coralloluteibacterium stylophorae TaxID=1776034 RepID=A0A8J8AYT7_9GAMM
MPVPPADAASCPLGTHLARALDDVDAGLCVGYSGGPDSTALLHALAALPRARALGLRALHVDHGLAPDSRQWAQACRTLARRLEVPLEVVRVDVARDAGDGLEAAARDARYRALGAALHEGERLVVAHHRDDQAETFLLRALRASGPDGLRGMRTLRPLGRGLLWRPLLDLSRATLADYVRAHALPVVEDPANADLRHDRSRLRGEVMPSLAARWPHVAAAFARSAALCAEAADLLEREDAAALALAQGQDPATLHVHALAPQPAPRRARLRRRSDAGLGLPPQPAVGIDAIERELLPAPADALPAFAWRDVRILRWGGLLHAGTARAPLPADLDLAWEARGRLALPGGGWLDVEPVAGATPGTGEPLRLRVHARRGGERIRLPGRAHSHALKHVLQDLGVPPWERTRLPLVSSLDGELLAAGDLVVSARMRDLLDARALRLVWQN